MSFLNSNLPFLLSTLHIISESAFSQQPIKFPLNSILLQNNQTGCSIKSLETTLLKWARNKNDTLVAYDCHDQFMDNSLGYVNPKNALKRNNTIMFQRACTSRLGQVPEIPKCYHIQLHNSDFTRSITITLYNNCIQQLYN